MFVKQIMTPEVAFVGPETQLKDIAGKMREMDVDCLPVMKADRLVGMITDRDIAYRAVANGRDPATTTARDVMSKEVSYCFDDQNVDDAVHIMEERHVRRLLVLDHDRQMVGILALGDLSRSAAHQRSTEAIVEALDDYYGWSRQATPAASFRQSFASPGADATRQVSRDAQPRAGRAHVDIAVGCRHCSAPTAASFVAGALLAAAGGFVSVGGGWQARGRNIAPPPVTRAVGSRDRSVERSRAASENAALGF
ncbi:MAG: CBS domain-containing protein [Alphaproteobacteria bacterium]